MNNLKNPLVIGGAIVILILAGLAWNYTEAIKEKNAIEKERLALDAGASKTVADESTVDLMKKKQECSKYLDKYLKLWNDGINGMLYLRPEVCYDKSRNTCILIEQMIYTETSEKELSITDLLTNKSLFDQMFSKDDPLKWTIDKLISDNSDCAQ
ncbi:MAG: hypothetical protein V1745_01585 [Patescibacteria group bacterium]